MTNSSISKLVKKDFAQNLATAMSNDASLTPQAAMLKITMDMLANNPYVPPKGCPVNCLPPEILANIFWVGTKMEEDGDLDGDDDDDDDEFDEDLEGWETEEDNMEVDAPARQPKQSGKEKVEAVKRDGDGDQPEEPEDDDDEESVLPFQVLVSHVCKHWREIALGCPSLWTTLTFFNEEPPFEKSRIWIQRANGQQLDIHLDCTIPDDEVLPVTPGQNNDEDEDNGYAVRAETHGRIYMEEHSDCRHPPPPLSLPDLTMILDILTPHVSQWRTLEVTCSVYEYMHLLLGRLSQCPSAPLLETLQLYHYEDCEDYEHFTPRELSTAFVLFQGDAPKLRDVALWGVHLDWDKSIPLLSGLSDFELAYHAKDVRPSWTTFTKILSASPDIRTLTLCLSGPADHDEETNDWGQDLLAIPSLKNIVLCYHEQKYAIALVQKLSIPHVHSLALDYDEEDYTEFARMLTKPIGGQSKSLLAGLEHLKISGLPCDNMTLDLIFEQLVGLKTLNLNCAGEEEEKYFVRLSKATGAGGSKLYCPNLQTITTSGIEGGSMKAFIAARKAAGAPIKRVLMSEEDDVDEQQEQWIRDNVEEFEFFEPSDSEEELVDVDEDDVDIDDEDDTE